MGGPSHMMKLENSRPEVYGSLGGQPLLYHPSAGHLPPGGGSGMRPIRPREGQQHLHTGMPQVFSPEMQQQQHLASSQAQCTSSQRSHSPQSPHTPQLTPTQKHGSSSGVSMQCSVLMDSTEQLLEEIFNHKQQQKEQLEKIRHYQKQVMIRPQKESYDILVQEHDQLKNRLNEELRTLQAMFQNTILSPASIHKLTYLVQDLKLQQIQLELFQQEIQRLTLSPQHPQFSRPVCALVIVEQPMPMVITKGKHLDDDPIIVQLLTGANVEIQSFSKVKVAMISDNQQVKLNSSKSIENDTQTMDGLRRIATFYLKFLAGTRKNSMRLRFGIQLQIVQNGAPQTCTVESNSSRPFIVITNECQWEESEGILLKKDTFGDQAEVTWQQFANVLQRHFLRATRQDLIRPTRQLLECDLEYLNQTFFDCQPIINQKSYDAFWEWLGKAVQKLRYQRHICPLWQTGLIYGFLTREGVKAALIHEEVGTFLIRLSERHPGMFALGYKTDDPDIEKSVRHYLIQPEDTSGAKKTLPDFLAASPAFQFILAVTNELENGAPLVRKVPKDAAFQPYYSKKNPLNKAKGYDDEIPVPYH